MKKLLSMVFIAFAIYAPAQIPEEGLVGYWPFSGNANDESGNCNHGIVSEAVLCADRFQNENSAYSFNGSTSHIMIPDSPLYAFDTLGFAVSFWANLESQAGGTLDYAAILIKSKMDVPWEGITMFADYPGAQQLTFRTTAYEEFQSSWTIEYGSWHHFVFHRIGGFLQLYVDGVPKGHYLTQKTDCTNDQPIWLGCNHGNAYTQNLNGMLDEVRIYNRSLSELEIYAMYEASALGINTPSASERFDVYPNPAIREVRIDAGAFYRLSETASIQLLNTAGQVVKTIRPEGRITLISLEDVACGGVYLIRLLDAGGTVLESRKLVIQK